MSMRVFQSFILLFGLLLCSGSSDSEKPMVGAIEHDKELNHNEKQLADSSSISTSQRDVTTPITTVPMINPTIPTANPEVNPLATPTTPTIMNPITTPTTAPPGSSWCVASQSASQTALQVALDYACGIGGSDCSAIQASASCFNPNTIHDHASYAFNQYYQKNPAPTSCNFGGTAMLTNTDPSSGGCRYPSTSTSSSVLNTTNPTGSTVYGSVPTGSTNSAVSMSFSQTLLFTSVFLIVLPLTVNHL